MNKWYGIGNLTKDIEFTTTNNGISVARFTIAVQRKYTNEAGEREADFINCVAWRKQAENLYKYCKKGDKISVVGALQIRSYEAHDGSKRYVTEVIADEIEFISIKKVENNEEQNYYFEPKEFNEDDLPF